MRNHVTGFCWTAALTLFTTANSQSLPYNPATILRPRFSTNPGNIAYAFLPSGSDQHLVVFNISATLSPSTLGLNTITSNLPFSSNDSVAFTPVVASNGEISVYTGSCNTSTSSALWRFIPSNTSSTGNGTWAQEITSPSNRITAASLPGADFLARGITFSTLVQANASQTKIYLFGGMCPVSNNTTAADWQSEASYSSSMLRLAPTTSTAKTAYTLDTTSSRGPPVPEAGFTITGLGPSYSNATGVDTQQQSFVLVGGHTQLAFINMSQVAVWSLPEESWTFVTVDSPSSARTNMEFTINSTVTSVDSRSGHSAVLSEDGSRIIVYGGWVGDVTTAADPQLAILELGSGYGGTGDWKWIVPTSQPSGIGMFGHGALMLPGNVMMVLGGYNISASSTPKRAVSVGTQALFFNATSMNWITQYTNPAYLAFLQRQAASQPSGTVRATKLGLGLGIGLGLLAATLAVIFCCVYSRRLRKRNERNREKIVEDLATGSFYSTPNRAMSQTSSGVFPWANRGWNGGQDSNSAVDGYVNLQNAADNGLEPVPPPPKPIKRKPLHSRAARGSYQTTAAFDFNSGGHAQANSLGTAGAIHPIYEADEDLEDCNDSDGVGVALGEPPRLVIPDSQRYSDPFKDGPSSLTSASYSGLVRRDTVLTHGSHEPESPAVSREREIQEWVTDWAAADLLLHSQTRIHSHTGRISPTRRAQLVAGTTVASVSGEEDSGSGRTESNLSERTERSVATSGLSRSGSSSQARTSRSNSLRGFITGINPFASVAPSTVATSTVMSHVFDGPVPRSYIPPRSADSSSSKSFNTARTSFVALQAEGETLLPRPTDEMSSGSVSPTRYSPETVPGSPSKIKPSAIALGKRRGQAGWLGSLRRVFISDDHNTSRGIGQKDLGFGGRRAGSRETSPMRAETTPAGSGSPPRRTVSAGATLWRRKQGRGDWDDSEGVSSGAGARASTFTGGDLSAPGFTGEGEREEDEEWDIERAVQNRVVQVMFTVPKERLRVVNHDVEEGMSVGSRSAGSSLKSKKGSGKRTLQGIFAVPPMEGQLQQAHIEGDVEEKDVSVIIPEETVEKRVEPSTPSKPETRILSEQEQVQTPGSGRSSPTRKKHTKVLEMVDKMEGRNSPERV